MTGAIAPRGVFGLAILLGASCHQPAAAQPVPTLPGDSPGRLCTQAVLAAERRHTLPAGLLFAIGLVESGRNDPVTQRRQPWPWAVQAGEQGYYFESKQQAVQWVRDAQAHGVSSIDTGCMQVNLHFHAHAFPTIEDAFDPMLNAEYAARFLLQLHAMTGNWSQAIGFYHSQTAELAVPYQARVERAMGGGVMPWAAPPKPPTLAENLSTAWRATATLAPSADIPPAENSWNKLLPASQRLPTVLVLQR